MKKYIKERINKLAALEKATMIIFVVVAFYGLYKIPGAFLLSFLLILLTVLYPFIDNEEI